MDVIEADLAGTATSLTSSHTPTSHTLLIDSRSAESIADLLASRYAAIAVTATHGWTGLTRLLFGSVTAVLLTRSPVPLLVTRAR